MFVNILETFLFLSSASLTEDLRMKKGKLITWLFITKLFLSALNTMLVSLRETLIMSGGKLLQSRLMIAGTVISMIGQSYISHACIKYGALPVFRVLFQISAVISLATFLVHYLLPPFAVYGVTDVLLAEYAGVVFYLYHGFFNMTCISLYWTVAGDALQSDAPIVFGAIAAGGTAGQLSGAVIVSTAANTVGAVRTLLILSGIAALGSASVSYTEELLPSTQSQKELEQPNNDQSYTTVDNKAVISTNKKQVSIDRGVLAEVYHELKDSVRTLFEIRNNALLRAAFLYALFFSCTIGLNSMERSAAAKRGGLSQDSFAGHIGLNQIGSTLLQFLIQLTGTSKFISYFGPTISLAMFALVRFIAFSTILGLQLFPASPWTAWYYMTPSSQVLVVLYFDSFARLVNGSISKISKETMWVSIPKDVKYRAKIVIDVFAYRLGTSVAAILGSFPITEYVVGLESTQNHVVLGVFICSVWMYCSVVMGTEISAAYQRHRDNQMVDGAKQTNLDKKKKN